MGLEERLQALEEEHQLVRGELKQTLVNVRDFLLELNLPALQEEEQQREIHEHEDHHSSSNDAASRTAPEEPASLSQSPQAMPAAGQEPSRYAGGPPPPQTMGGAIPGNISVVNQVGSDMAPPPITTFTKEELFWNEEKEPEPEPEEETFDAAEDEEFEDEPSVPAPQNQQPEWPSDDTGTVEEIEGDDDSLLEEEIDDAGDSFLEEETGELPEDFADIVPINEEEFEELEEPEDMENIAEAPVATQQESRPLQDMFPRPGKKTAAQRASQVNLLTNLIRWVTVARKEIGTELLPAFLDVYGIGDIISDDVRQTIMYLTETLAPRQTAAPSDETGDAGVENAEPGEDKAPHEIPAERAQPMIQPNGEVWNRMILELHGILRCSEVSFEDTQLPWKRAADQVQEAPQPATAPPSDEVPAPAAEDPTAITGAEAEADSPPTAETAAEEEQVPAEDQVEEEPEEEIEEPRPRGRTKKSAGKKGAQEPVGARLKLVLPVGDDQETEIEIGEFALNLGRKN